MRTTYHKKVTSILLAFVIGATVGLLWHTPNLSVGLALSSWGYAVIVLLREHVLKINLRTRAGIAYMCMQLVIALILCIWSESFVAQIYLLILIGEFTFYHSRVHSMIFTILTYVSILIGVLTYREFISLKQEVYLLLPRVIDFLAIYGMSYLAKVAVQQRDQLASDNEQLRAASIELERKAKLQERTRIAREIHDSVGHTLTSALTGLQTAEYAIEKQRYELAAEMIGRTRHSILSGLDDVRSTVHLLRDNFADHRFIPELTSLIRETQQQTATDITFNIDAGLPDMPPMVELTIYRALQEGITNGIRHGSSTAFRFSLMYNAGYIQFTLTDNGQITQPIVYGFGLSAMKERVEEVGGTMTITPNATNGLTLAIAIPHQQNYNQTERV